MKIEEKGEYKKIKVKRKHNTQLKNFTRLLKSKCRAGSPPLFIATHWLRGDSSMGLPTGILAGSLCQFRERSRYSRVR
jgi:hypothetical protein